MDYKLPPVDRYRQPFIVPLGTMAYWAAALEMELVEFSEKTYFTALGRAKPIENADGHTFKELAARALVNWNRAYLNERVECVPEEHRAEAREVIERIEAIRTRRNRLLHDVIEVGIDEPDEQGLVRVYTMSIGYPRKGKSMEYSEITPDIVCAVAMELHDACKDLEVITIRLM